MGWEKHIIEQHTSIRQTVKEPKKASLGEALTKLLAWKELTYSILDSFRVHELIETKIN